MTELLRLLLRDQTS